MECTEIKELLPQIPPFMMVDELVKYEPGEAETVFTVREDNVMLQDGVLSSAGLMENIAQTSAARIGYYYKYILKEPVKIGFIGAVSKYEVRRLAPVGSTIVTRIDIQEEIFGMSLAKAVVTLDGEIIATAELKLAVRPARPENQN